MNWAVIMAGGYGERFWPMSRRKQPKQLLPIVGNRTMIQQTVARLSGVVPPSRTVVVTNAEQAPLVRRQLPRVKHVIAEPVGRNTAPCIALAAEFIGKHDPDAVMVVVPADSFIKKAKRYRQVVSAALDLAARRDVLITVGIKPDRPATGYGYIHYGKGFTRQGVRFSDVQEFVEKPDLKTARLFVQSGQYRWNAGMFVWHVGSIRAAFKKYQPDMWRQIEKITDAKSLKRIYPKLGKISVDYAIMEKAGNVVVASGDFDWDDVGDWPAVERHYPKDAHGNVARGEAVALNANNCVIVSAGNHLVAVVGVNDLVVVHTPDATLICHKSDAQRVREIPKQLAGQPKYKKLL